MSNIASVHRFMDLITARDLEGYQALCAPGYTLWHSYNQVDMDIEASMRALRMMVAAMPEIEYFDRDIFAAPDGTVIAQYVCRGETILGEAVALHVMLRIYFDPDGLIRRIEEYVDSAECAVIRRAGESLAQQVV